jgi:hypothetical protein
MPGGGDVPLFPVDSAAPTAKTLSERAVCVDPQVGHAIFASLALLIERTSCSNFASHDLHTYS